MTVTFILILARNVIFSNFHRFSASIEAYFEAYPSLQ